MEKGEKFEILVEKLYKKMGYKVERRKVLRGMSGAYHEVDLYAYKNFLSKKIAIECKWRENLEVGKKDLANFYLVLQDTKIKEGHMVTNSFYSKQTKILAKSYGIKLIDGKALKDLLKKYSLDTELPSQDFSLTKILESLIFSTIDFLNYNGIIY
ncbi:MAG: restriction endonuclease [Candidatus Aenigmatarchaeota archaeon]